MTYDEGFAAGMRRAADIATLHDGADVTDCKDAGEGYDKAAFDICTAILAAIPASASWTPPPEAERPDFFACLGWALDEWLHIVWLRGQWLWAGTYDVAVTPTHFAPLPPTPEDAT